jgi:hypothetical protein
MGTLTELRVPIVRKAVGQFRGRNYLVSLLPGDVIEFRLSWGREAYRVSLAELFEHVMNTQPPTKVDAKGYGDPA